MPILQLVQRSAGSCALLFSWVRYDMAGFDSQRIGLGGACLIRNAANYKQMVSPSRALSIGIHRTDVCLHKWNVTYVRQADAVMAHLRYARYTRAGHPIA